MGKGSSKPHPFLTKTLHNAYFNHFNTISQFTQKVLSICIFNLSLESIGGYKFTTNMKIPKL